MGETDIFVWWGFFGALSQGGLQPGIGLKRMAHESRILQMQSFVCSSLSVGGPLRDCPGHLWQHVQSRLQEPRWILSTAHWCGSLSWCLVKELAYSLLVFALHDPTSCNMLHLTWLKVWFRSEQKGCCRQLPRSKNIWAVWPETSRKGSKSIFQIQRASAATLPCNSLRPNLHCNFPCGHVGQVLWRLLSSDFQQ